MPPATKTQETIEIPTRRGSILELSAESIGRVWTREDHEYLVSHIRQIEELAEAVVLRAQEQRKGAA